MSANESPVFSIDIIFEFHVFWHPALTGSFRTQRVRSVLGTQPGIAV